jgi:hypothetical protein
MTTQILTFVVNESFGRIYFGKKAPKSMVRLQGSSNFAAEKTKASLSVTKNHRIITKKSQNIN